MSSSRGNLYVISGFAGTGKSTVVNCLMKKGGYALSISCTSRAPRAGEVDGREYHFISHGEFLRRIDEGYFLEHAVYVDHAYGTPAGFVEENLAAGKDVLLEIEMQGALQVRGKYPDTVLIFITPPSVEELRRRLVERNTETPEQINKRLRRAADEGQYMDQYDYILVNDKLESCVEELDTLIRCQRARVSCNHGLVSRIQDELCGLRSNMK